ncbi:MULTISPECIES: RagB/SusD family nutrient uptake outer membrane protein [Spirosoma]|uniref:RagB/SusD family nutrient uptake outer membrane protein n=1 Tax=Spirosoma sordidisoli TaxID=2502893 RepID=A0A4Q2UV65_9BACT|nr:MULTISPECIES: RagB/SusD family nutrient uptake outer membrane protein [Spirosoma]RYC71755.1 RagB/SusD family nutrient uptake outer membrane protein [Spirosoma sordidisoli]
MKHRFILLSLAATVALTACDRSLDIVNPNQVTTESFWKTSDDALAGVNAVYSTTHRGGISRWLPFYYIIRSDEGRSQSPATDIVNNMDQFLVTDYNYGNAYSIWNDNYIGINRANQVINNVPTIQMDAALRDRYLGEAKFMRALFYYHLVTLWGNVPLVLQQSVVGDKPNSATSAEVWAQIEKDLTEAATVLPTTYGSTELGRATRGAAYALLAKAQMQQRKYTEALTPLQWLADGEGKSLYALVPNYRDNFLISTENNRESVFEWQFEENPAEFTDDDTETPNQNYGTSIAQFFGPSSIGWSDGEAHRWPIYEFTERTTAGARDPRLEASFLFDSTDVRGPNFTQIYGETFTQRYGTGNKRVWFRKFQNDHWKIEEGYRSPNNWRYIRYADVLLMYAEALNATGKTSQAYPYVDQVRRRAGLPALSVARPGLSQEQFLAQLKHERVTELSGEGHRWNDLARWGDLGPQLAPRDPAFSTFVRGKSELLPIPQLDRDLNPNLQQNPNY